MSGSTPIIFYVDARVLLVGMSVFFLALLALVWKGRKEIEEIIDNKIGNLSNSAPKLISAIIELQAIISTKVKGVIVSQSLVETTGSPLAPTEFGAELIKKSGLEKVLNENKEDFCIKLRAVLPKEYTEYDVQEHARNLLVNLKDDSIMNPVKEYVYNNPVDIEIILKAGGLWLRDDFLNKPRQINTNK